MMAINLNYTAEISKPVIEINGKPIGEIRAKDNQIGPWWYIIYSQPKVCYPLSVSDSKSMVLTKIENTLYSLEN